LSIYKSQSLIAENYKAMNVVMTRVQAQKPPKEAEAMASNERWAVDQQNSTDRVLEYRERPMKI
jgi:hypothetical protein